MPGAQKERAKEVSKYNAIKTNGYASKKEAKRAQELALLVRAGAITTLVEQIPYTLIPSQRRADGATERACVYIADFQYTENGKLVVEDVKGVKTPAYVIKRKLMLFMHKISIREI